MKRLACLGLVSIGAATACADHIQPLSTTMSLWSPMTTAAHQWGYLDFRQDPIFGRFGDEWTGWVDIRHPSLAGTNDLERAYDRSDHWVEVLTTTLINNTPLAAVPPGLPEVPRPERARDFDYANKAYLLQAGLFPQEFGHRTNYLPVLAPPPLPDFSYPLRPEADLVVRQRYNVADDFWVNTYYVTSIHNPDPKSVTHGLTYYPHPDNPKPGIFVADTARNDTFSHELGHFLLAGRAGHSPDAQGGHSTEASNLMAAGDTRTIPTDVAQVGPRRSALVGGVNQLAQSQVKLIYESTYVWLRRNLRAGDRVDFDFEVDHLDLESETLIGADNEPGPDFLFWEPGTTEASLHEGVHVHTGLGEFRYVPDFDGGTFRFADVISLSVRYSDSDVMENGDWSGREGALDYELWFRAVDGSMRKGEPILAFIPGWSETTYTENWLTRWRSPVDATGVWITGLSEHGHDGTSQIDALIVYVPEPGTAALLGLGSLLRFAAGRRRR